MRIPLNLYSCIYSAIAALLLVSCESGQNELPAEAMQGIALQDMLAEEEYWEGTKLEYTDLFITNDKNLFIKKNKSDLFRNHQSPFQKGHNCKT